MGYLDIHMGYLDIHMGCLDIHMGYLNIHGIHGIFGYSYETFGQVGVIFVEIIHYPLDFKQSLHVSHFF